MATVKKSRRTSTSSDKTSTTVAHAARAGRSKRERKRRSSSTFTEVPQFTKKQLAALEPFFALAAEIDDVFTENDAMAAEKRQMGMGRLYRSWKAWRIAVDPDFDPERYRVNTRGSA